MKFVNILTKEALEESYQELNSLKAVGKKFNVDPGTIKKYMQFYGLNFKSQIRYSCDYDFFSRENEESFYLAGFIAADGCIKKRKNSSKNLRHDLQITLSMSDKKHLENIKNIIKSEHPIYNFLIKNSKRNLKWNDSWSSQLTITSEKIVNDLEKFNITPKKSLTYKFPLWLVDHPLCNHFMRGYFDGDGCFCKRKRKNNYQLYFSLRGTSDFLQIYRSILERECNLKVREKPIRVNSNIGILEYGGNIILGKITDYLYKDSKIFLDRKRDIIK